MLLLLLSTPAQAAELTGETERGGRRMDWRAWIPEGEGPFPLLVGLHGRSRHVERYAFYFLDAGRAAPREHPVAVLAPRIDWDAPWIETQRVLFAMIDDLAAAHPVDRSRIVLLGFSMGASSALHLLRHNPRRFSAVWAASGHFPEEALAHLRRLPVRVLLSWSGGAGQCSRTEQLAREVDRGRAEARAVVFPGGDHEPHLEMLRDPALLGWLVGVPADR